MGITIKFIGMDNALNALDNLEKSLTEAIFDEVEKSTINIESKTKDNTPVRTGILKGSYTHEIERNEYECIGEVGTNVKYAPMLEYGTSKQKAQPHLRPAYESEIKFFKERIEQIVRRGGK